MSQFKQMFNSYRSKRQASRRPQQPSRRTQPSDNSVVSGSFGTIKLGEIKMFTKCEMRSKMKLCMNQDIKNKVESNFGPMQSILQQTQLTEAEFFPLVMQLLHGEEIDYMTGSM